MCLKAPSDSPQQQQDDQNQEDQSDSAAGIGSPGLTVAPGGQGANEQKDQDDDQDDSHDIFLLSSFSISPFISFKEILRCFGLFLFPSHKRYFYAVLRLFIWSF
jgi:hypothetical protein